MNNKGFTLIEILAVVVILGIITTISITGISSYNNKIKNEMLNKKYELIQESAVMWGEDNRNEILTTANTKKYNGYSCLYKLVADFIPDYLDADSTNCTIGTNCVVDPSNENHYLDNVGVVVYYKNKRVYAKANVGSSVCS